MLRMVPLAVLGIWSLAPRRAMENSAAMDFELSPRLARARFRAWHRGTREADLMIGGFFERYHRHWDDAALAWFEALLDEDEADVLAWALGAQPVPARFAGPQLEALQKLDYVPI